MPDEILDIVYGNSAPEILVLAMDSTLGQACPDPAAPEPAAVKVAELRRGKGPASRLTLAVFGGPSGTRTPNLLIKSQLLYQLS